MLLPGKAGDRRVAGADNRLFIEAVLWIARTGSPWRDLPQELGNWHTTFTRFNRWSQKGVSQKIMLEIGEDADLVQLTIDSTVAHVHQHAAGAKKAGDQALGRSRGGLSTKVHVAVDGIGSPVRIFLSGGLVTDISHAQA